MQQPASNQDHNVCVKMNSADYLRLKDRYAKTTCRTLAEYLRKIILLEPVTINHRDASLDELVNELSLTRRHLADAVQAFQLSAQKISATTAGKALIHRLKEHESDRDHVAKLIEQIYEHCKKAAYLWLQ